MRALAGKLRGAARERSSPAWRRSTPSWPPPSARRRPTTLRAPLVAEADRRSDALPRPPLERGLAAIGGRDHGPVAAGPPRPAAARAVSDILELVIERPVAGGRMLARHDGRIVFVSGAIPGERVRARVERVSKQSWWAKTVDVLDASPDRREPACDPACGGMAFAHIRYERQRELKQQILVDAFRRLGRVQLDAPAGCRRFSGAGLPAARQAARRGRPLRFLPRGHAHRCATPRPHRCCGPNRSRRRPGSSRRSALAPPTATPSSCPRTSRRPSAWCTSSLARPRGSTTCRRRWRGSRTIGCPASRASRRWCAAPCARCGGATV